MLNIIIPVALIVFIFGILMSHLTGSELIIITYRSAFFRFSGGLIASLFPVSWWGFNLNETFTTNPLGTKIIIYFLIAFSTSAVVLIALSIIQFAGCLIKEINNRYTNKHIVDATENVCPSCSSDRLQKKSTFTIFFIFIIIFISLIIFARLSYQHNWDLLFVIAYIISPFILGSIVVSGISAAFGKNKCLSCNYHWR